MDRGAWRATTRGVTKELNTTERALSTRTRVPISQFLPLPFSPLVSIYLFYVCLFRLTIYTMFLESTYAH